MELKEIDRDKTIEIAQNLINFDTSVVTPNNGTLEFIWDSPGSGTCTLTCHGKKHDAFNY